MNCASHLDGSAVAYCRVCGKALCARCTRPVRGVIYCEDCLGAKMEGNPVGAIAFLSSTSPKFGQLELRKDNLTKTYEQGAAPSGDDMASGFLGSLCRCVRDAFLWNVFGNLELLAALCDNAPKEIEIKWWEVPVRPSKRK